MARREKESWSSGLNKKAKEEQHQQKQIDDLNSQLEYLKNEVHHLRFNNRRLSEQLAEQTVIKEELEKKSSDLTIKEHCLQNKCREHESECMSLKLKLTGLEEDNQSSSLRIEELEKHASQKSRKLRDLSRNVDDVESEKEETKHQLSELTDRLEKMTTEQKSLKLTKQSLEQEASKLRQQIDDLVSQNAKEKSETESNKSHADMISSRIQALEQENQQFRRTNKELKSENEKYLIENENIKTRKRDLEVQKDSKERDALDLKKKLSVLEASSSARDKSQTESFKRETERMRQEHKSTIDEIERRHAAERTEMQDQIEMFLKTLNDDKRMERDTVRKAIQQLAETNTATNQILNAAFAAYQRNVRPQATRRAANIRPMSNDD